MTKNSLTKLIEIAGLPLSAARGPMPAGIRKQGGHVADQLDDLLLQKNGFLAFESALHVLPLGPTANDLTLLQWNAPDLWRTTYGDLALEGLFFAEDVFGNQFFIGPQGVSRFDAETGEAELLAHDLEGWAKAILDDYDYLTGFPLAHDWQTANGALNLGHRLVPIRPFVIGGEYSLSNLRSVSASRGMRWRGEIASQIKRLPDGAAVTFKALE